MHNYLSNSPTLTNVTFSGNSAEYGGGMANVNSSSPTLKNVTFSGNSAIEGGGTYNDGNSNPQIRNTILWGNTATTLGAQIYNSGANTSVVSDTVVQGGFAGGTNIVITDPLLGTLGNFGGFTRTIPLLPGSSAIDTGNDATCAATDQRGITRPQGAHCDIGAYEYVDTTEPAVDTFAVTTPSNSLNIPITAFTAIDDVSVTGYLISTSATPPAPGAPDWTGTAPITYTVASDGTYTLYPWAKDAASNVSAVFGSPRTVVVDATRPTVTSIIRANPSPDQSRQHELHGHLLRISDRSGCRRFRPDQNRNYRWRICHGRQWRPDNLHRDCQQRQRKRNPPPGCAHQCNHFRSGREPVGWPALHRRRDLHGGKELLDLLAAD